MSVYIGIHVWSMLLLHVQMSTCVCTWVCLCRLYGGPGPGVTGVREQSNVVLGL